VWTGLLLVDTAPLKTSLTARADAMIEALLSQLLMKSIQVSWGLGASVHDDSRNPPSDASSTPSTVARKAV
jgi:hypothetical protein